jgi:bifunctional DNA-binding transcriptional regulator/antitoxin component of YhaV-PrlF toxin-antitoxin module
VEIEIVVELRRKNQMTLPEKIAEAMQVGEGSRLVVTYDDQTGEGRFRPLRDSYAGTLKGVYGANSEEIARHIEEFRRDWDER